MGCASLCALLVLRTEEFSHSIALRQLLLFDKEVRVDNNIVIKIILSQKWTPHPPLK